jgi:sortase A
MTLTIPSLGLKNAPVLNSGARSALDKGAVHLPDTSLPWSDTPERNVYLAGHRLGWLGTVGHLVFYRLNELTGGDRITLRGPNGKRYDYRVLESFIVGPRGNWVTGRVRGRDLLTLQTCTPIPRRSRTASSSAQSGSSTLLFQHFSRSAFQERADRLIYAASSSISFE